MTRSSLAYIASDARLEVAGSWRAASPDPTDGDVVLAAQDAGSSALAELRFGHFRLLPGARSLLRDGAPVQMGSRAFDMLHVLACARGSVVAKEDLVSRVWPTTVVEESNLRYQIGVLRKALGPDRDLVKTVAGRGYLLAAHSEGEHAARSAPARAEPGAEEERHSIVNLIRSVARPADGPPGPDFGLGSKLAPEGREALRLLLRALLEDLSEIAADASLGDPALGRAASGA